jgi:branched-chain amino acid aminotransferase
MGAAINRAAAAALNTPEVTARLVPQGEETVSSAQAEAMPARPPEPIIYVNGEFLPQSQAKVSVLDHAFLYGDGVFDSLCARSGYVFMLDEHLDRLYRSVFVTRLDFSMPKEELRELVLEAVRRNGLLDSYIKVVVSRGVSPEPLLTPTNCKTGLVIFARPWASLVDPAKGAKGISARIVSIRRVPHESLEPKVKSLNYLNVVLAKIEAMESGCDDAIMLDTHGYVCEGPGYNIFAVVDGELITPSQEILAGITRKAVMLIAGRLGIRVREGLFTPYDFYTAQEVFFCSTAGGIIPITRVDDRAIGGGTVGPTTARISSAYMEMLETGEFGTPVYAQAQARVSG